MTIPDLSLTFNRSESYFSVYPTVAYYYDLTLSDSAPFQVPSVVTLPTMGPPHQPYFDGPMAIEYPSTLRLAAAAAGSSTISITGMDHPSTNSAIDQAAMLIAGQPARMRHPALIAASTYSVNAYAPITAPVGTPIRLFRRPPIRQNWPFWYDSAPISYSVFSFQWQQYVAGVPTGGIFRHHYHVQGLVKPVMPFGMAASSPTAISLIGVHSASLPIAMPVMQGVLAEWPDMRLAINWTDQFYGYVYAYSDANMAANGKTAITIPKVANSIWQGTFTDTQYDIVLDSGGRANTGGLGAMDDGNLGARVFAGTAVPGDSVAKVMMVQPALQRGGTVHYKGWGQV